MKRPVPVAILGATTFARRRQSCAYRYQERPTARKGGKAFPLAGASVAGTPPSAGTPRNAPRVRVRAGFP
jgi:hypothetical protein